MRFSVNMSVEATRERFVQEFVQRQGGSVGLETNIAGFVDARRRFFIAIQGWEKTAWMRPLLTRLEGYFEKTATNSTTQVYFMRRGLALPLTVLSLLIPYGIARATIRELPLEPYHIFMMILSFSLVVLIGGTFMILERRIYKQLTAALLAAYDRPALEQEN